MENNPYHAPAVSSYGTPAYSQNPAVAEIVVSQLVRTKPWVRLFSVLTFIGAGFLLLAAVAMLAFGGIAASTGMYRVGGSEGAMMGGIALLYLVMAALYIYPGIKLWKYASRIATLAATRTELDLEGALNEQRAFWKFAGIAVIVIFGLYLVGIFAVTVGGVIAGSQMK